MKIIIYTANIGNYDDYYNIYVKEKDVDYYYFTDNADAELCGWNKIVVEKQHEDNTKSARYYKCNPHLVLPKHDVSIWVDARFGLKTKHIHKFLDRNINKKTQVSCYYHNRHGDQGGCSYIEGFVIGSKGIDDEKVVLKQLDKYTKEGFPRKYGLFATGVIVRRNTKEVNKFNETWWNEIKNGSKRDQISQMYSAWKTGVTISPLEGNVYGNKLVIKKQHIHKQYGLQPSE